MPTVYCYSGCLRHSTITIIRRWRPATTPAATFRDIAFNLRGQGEIHAMWQMICETSDIRATFEVLHADGVEGRVALVDHYTFSDTSRKVRNVIDSTFRFQNGVIIQHRDHCDPRAWAEMAFPGVSADFWPATSGSCGASRRGGSSRRSVAAVQASVPTETQQP